MLVLLNRIMPINPAIKIQDVLLERGLITRQKYDEIAVEHIKTQIPVKEILLREKVVNEETFTKMLAELSGGDYIDLSHISSQQDAINLIGESTARKYNVLPIKIENNRLQLAGTDNDDLELIQTLERTTGHSIDFVLGSAEQIEKAIDREYGKTLGENISEAIEVAAATSTQKLKESLKNIDQADEIIKVSPVAQIVSVILEYAVKSGASDIHIEPFETKTRIRYRIDGVLIDKFPLPITIHNSIIARIKILASMPIDEKRKPLDGKFKVEFGDKRTDLRVSTIPTVNGEKCVIRLLKSDQDRFTLDQLGMWGEALENFKKGLSQTTGIILVTGPTGSGKTVTLATSLDGLNKVSVNIITLEDPVEINIQGVNQVQINTAAGLTFAAGLRSILRQDPNIIMVGEIRDVETAKLAIQAALTGHLVLATLHTNSAVASIPRLIDMGVEPFLLASTIDACLAQRLTRRLCPYCKERIEATPAVADDIRKVLGERLLKIAMGPNMINQHAEDYTMQNHELIEKQSIDDKKIYIYKAKGCEKCNNGGYKGRIGLYEVIKSSSEIRRLTESNSPIDALEKQAKQEGMITLMQDGYIKALWGVTTLEEVLTVADE